MAKITIPVPPMGKPRMTQRDRWAQRDCVVRYRAYCDAIREHLPSGIACSGTVNWRAYFPIPESWSKKRKTETAGKPHTQKPDRDNIDKGLLDCLFRDDSIVWRGTLEKYWDDGKGPRIELEVL